MSAVAPGGGDPPGSTQGTQPGAGADPTIVRMLLGNQLRRLREAAGVSPDQAGYEIRASRSKISRLENGRVSFKDRDVADLLSLYGVIDEQVRTSILALAKRANIPGWWSSYSDILPEWFSAYLSLEASASIIRGFEMQFVHGLFQTADYARAVTSLGHKSAAAEEIERRVALRITRQGLLTRPDPPRIWLVMDEAVLRRPVGGRQVLRAQLRHLAEISTLPHVTIQVMPFSRGGHAAAGGSFTLLRFAEPDLPDVVYIEQLTSALYLDQRDDVDHYLEVADQLSAEALTPVDTVSLLTSIIADS